MTPRSKPKPAKLRFALIPKSLDIPVFKLRIWGAAKGRGARRRVINRGPSGRRPESRRSARVAHREKSTGIAISV